MPEQELLKVYELAKELGIDSISLLDKLKGLNIQVKTHMSELREEDVKIARASLRKTAEPGKGKSSHKTVQKDVQKNVTRAAGKPASRFKKAAEKKSADSGAQATSPRASEQAPVERKTVAPIIRRRKAKSEDAEQAQLILPEGEVSAGAPSRAEDGDGEMAVATSAAESPDKSVKSVAADGMRLEPEEPREALPEAERGKLEPAPSLGKAEGPGSEISNGVGTAVENKGMGTAQRTAAPVRKSILKIVEAAKPVLRPVIKPAAQPAQQPKAVVKGTATQDKDGFRIIKMTKENLDQMAEEEAARKRLGRDANINPEDVRFADYRKKEMIFLPRKKRLPVGKEVKKTQITVAKAQKRIIEMQDFILVQELANGLSIRTSDVIKKLMALGQMVTVNQSLDFDTASLVAGEYQFEVRNVAFSEASVLGPQEDKPEELKPRPPVVTIMGHVDHGKTTLLDSIRESNVAAGEAGGITQHIGAYTIEKNGRLITFIDTPGHEAFTVMRARGANVTDIVILVVAADDGVMPQTREAISHAQAAKVPIIVAVNKIDKPGANVEKIKQTLAELNLLAEDWGGEVMFVPLSALKKTNIDKLLDAILLQAEVLELKANPDARASGIVLEAKVERGRGPVVSVLIDRGTLKAGDAIVSGECAGRVKAMVDHKGQMVKSAGPAIAVEVLGLEGIPDAGKRFDCASTESDAKRIAENRANQAKAKALASRQVKMSLDDLFARIQSGEVKELNVILKADVYGSVEAIRDSLLRLSTDKVKVKVIHSAPGGISESDILLASASKAIVIGFNVRPETKSRQLADSEHVEIKCYDIIYELIDDIKKAMTGLLDKKKVEKLLGRAEVRQVFSVSKIGTIAGSSVIDGKIVRGANVRLLRDSRVIYDGKMGSLRRFKDDAKEVATGFECGIGIENYNDLKPGDIIEAYQVELVNPMLEAQA